MSSSKPLRVIDFNCGIGGRTEGFLRAGYEVSMAVENQPEKADIYIRSYQEEILLLHELKENDYPSLPDSEVFTGRIRIPGIVRARTEYENYNRDVEADSSMLINAIISNRPKACLIECSTSIKSGHGSDYFNHFTEQLSELDYKVFWERLSSGDYVDIPLKEKKTYIIAIRHDVSGSEFQFPEARFEKNSTLDFRKFFEKRVDSWYKKVNYDNFRTIKGNKLYKSVLGHYEETQEIDTGMMATMYVTHNENARRFTHNEMAKCKGLVNYNYNNCLNKKKMYEFISEASNAYVIEALAKQLGKAIQGEDADTWQELTTANDKAAARLSGFEYEHEKENEEDETMLLPYKAEDIRIDQKMISLYQIYRWMKQGTLDLSPEFQRNFVWDRNKKSLLIESLMLNIPIPAFYFDENEDGMKSVIDGVQRLSTIYSFLKDEFRLKGLQYLTNCNRLTFSELEKKYQTRIEDTQLAVNILDARCPDMVKFDVFRRINTGGVPLNSQEVRNILATPMTRKLLINMATCSEFVDVTRNRVKDIRMGAQEICLRFLTYYDSYDEEKRIFTNFGEMNRMLNEEIIQLNRMDESQVEFRFELLRKSMRKCKALFGEQAFTKAGNPNIINRALFTSWSVVLAKHDYDEIVLANNKEKVTQKVQDMLRPNSEYFAAITSTTSSRKNMMIQFMYAERILEELDV